jgi:uncharacterized protein (TIGR02117 family)
VGLGLPACRGPAPSLVPPSPGQTRPVYVVRHAWHTRVAVRLADVDPALWPESRALGDVTYVEVGWGDHDYYQADDATVGQALRAAFTPTRAALHVGGIDAPIPAAFPGQEIARIDVSPGGLDRLARYIHASYARDDAGRPIRTRHGRYPASAFYAATGTYHLMNNSNHWTARALREAGAPISPESALTAGNVMSQVRRAAGRE